MRKLRAKKYASIALVAFRQWRAHDSLVRASAMAFLAVFLLPSLLYITSAVFVLIFGQSEGLYQVVRQINTIAGPTIAELIQQLLEVSKDPLGSFVSIAFSLAFTIAGAVAIYQILHETLNAIWGSKPLRRKKMIRRISDNVGAFLLISALGFLLVIWTSVTSVLVGTFNPTTIVSILLRLANVFSCFSWLQHCLQQFTSCCLT